MRTRRIEELMAGITAFGKEAYHKDELLGEMFALQEQIVKQTFNEEHASTGELKIWDVENHLEKLNEECGHPADEELRRFKEGSKTLCNLIKAEISGNRGEYKVFKTLEYLHTPNVILKNVELSDGVFRTELDAVVITPKCLTIIEVKNTAKDIFIDEEGHYYRTGEFLKWDCNIAEKMSLKEEMLRKVIEEAGYKGLQVRSIVVFTNNRIEVQNKYRQIRTCFVSQLAYIIEGYRLDERINNEDMNLLKTTIEKAECKEAYPFEFDVKQYKMDFANLMAILEEATARKEEIETEATVTQEHREKVHTARQRSLIEKIRWAFGSGYSRRVGGAAAAVAISVITSAVAASTISKGGI